ncbi:MAG: hypothetical protein KBC38_00960 [Candidatus Pacebacteria bacterium]|nr:hypothetical protein [Candidatus Paceibacterota bacterium]MBP9840207.1 hypothetical protein [Candidatus Paceibacterota bacterium]
MALRHADFVLRLALAFSLLYPAVHAWFEPLSWLGYIPALAAALWPFSNEVLLHLFGAVEIVLAFWLLSGRRIAVPAALSALILVFIVVTNPVQFEVLFRDLSIAGIAIALALLHWKRAEPKLG